MAVIFVYRLSNIAPKIRAKEYKMVKLLFIERFVKSIDICAVQ